MKSQVESIYRFDEFELHAEGPALYFRGELVEGGGKKALQVLLVYLDHPHELVPHDVVLNEVWGDGSFGVTSDTINQYISQIRVLLAKYDSKEYFKNKKGRGYVFSGDVRETVFDPPQADAVLESRPATPVVPSGLILVSALLLAVVVGAAAFWHFYPDNSEAEIRAAVKESQMFESLVLYKNPADFREGSLDQFWTKEVDGEPNSDRRRIRDSVAKLVSDDRRYGDETKCEKFEIQFVRINDAKNFADVRTLEKWFIAEYSGDGKLLKNRSVGPYFVSYNVQKIDGRWLIERSTTARSTRPVAFLKDIEFVTQPIAGRQFLVRITGRDFEPEFVYIEAVGPGCPDARPCRVPNSALRETASMTEAELSNVPMTLASGTFKIFVHNGESQPSNPVFLTIP